LFFDFLLFIGDILIDPFDYAAGDNPGKVLPGLNKEGEYVGPFGQVGRVGQIGQETGFPPARE